MTRLVFALLFFLPAGVANTVPLLVSRSPWLQKFNTPVDFGKSWRGKRVFGDNKTWRGIISGTALAGLTGLLEYLVLGFLGWGNSWAQSLVLGLLLGLGALIGDAVASFFKRRLGVGPGQSWFPFDQLDYIAGGLALSSLVVRLTSGQYLAIVILWFVIHLIGAFAGYKLGLKSQPI